MGGIKTNSIWILGHIGGFISAGWTKHAIGLHALLIKKVFLCIQKHPPSNQSNCHSYKSKLNRIQSKSDICRFLPLMLRIMSMICLLYPQLPFFRYVFGSIFRSFRSFRSWKKFLKAEICRFRMYLKTRETPCNL